MFNEMVIEPELSYNKFLDKIEGLEDCGEGLNNKISDHVMLFMIRGIKKKWKHPLAFFFSEGEMKTHDSVRNMK